MLTSTNRLYRRFSEAQAAYRKVIDLDSRAASAYSALGIVEHQRGNFQDAIARYHEVSLAGIGSEIES